MIFEISELDNSELSFHPIEYFCRYCFDKNQSPVVYESHYMYHLDGKAMCPDIRAKGCSNCGRKGDYAHGREDCPYPTIPPPSVVRKPVVIDQKVNKATLINVDTKKKKNQSLWVKLLKKLMKESLRQRKQKKVAVTSV